MAHFVNGIGCDDLAYAPKVAELFSRANITTRAQLKTYIASNTLPGGATITPAQFGRALAVLGLGLRFLGENDNTAADVG